MFFMQTFRILLTSGIIGFVIYPALIKVLKQLKVMDVPGGRKIHHKIIPSMGGIGFICSTFLAIAFWFSHADIVETRYLLASFGLMFFVGLRDDLVNLTAWQKLSAQLVAAYMVVVVADVRVTSLFGFLSIEEIPLLLSYALSLFIIISLTNAFNLIDGLDGLAGIIAVLIFIFFGFWYSMAEMYPYAYFSFALVGGILSFLIFNWHPAKIFMGDTGSLSLGFAIAVLTVLFIESNGYMKEASPSIRFDAPYSTALALLIIPVFDTTRVFVRRILNGKSPMTPDKSHLHHFLMRMGLSHAQVALTLAGITLVFISVSISLRTFSDNWMVPFILLVSIILAIKLDYLTLKVVKRKVAKTPPLLSLRKNPAVEQSQKFKISTELLKKSVLRDN